MQLLTKARTASAVFFFVNGAVVGCWVPFIPERAHALGLSPGSLGTVLLGGGVGAVLAMPLAGKLISRFGSRPVSTLCGVAFALALLLNAVMPHRWALLLSLVFYGMAGAGMDVSMNAQAVLVEDLMEQRILSSLHGLFSLGNVVGSFAMSAAFARDLPRRPLAAFAAAVLVTSIGLCGRWMLREDAGATRTADAHRTLDPRLLLLGALVVTAMICEGGTADWSGLYLRKARGLGPGWAGVGFGVFGAFMLTGRLLGDRVTARLGEVQTLRLGGLLAATGAVLVAFGPREIGPLLGFALFGTGLANASPVLYRAAGQVPGVPAGVGLATAVGMGYAGLLAGPPVLGVVGQVLGLRAIFLVMAALCMVLSLRAATAKPASSSNAS